MQTTSFLSFLVSISLAYGQVDKMERMQKQLDSLQNQLKNMTACFEDMTDAKCTGSKSGMVGIVEAIRVDGNWGPWSQWSDCSSSCGGGTGGTQTRSRTCDQPPPKYGGKCPGETIEEKACNADACCQDGWTAYDNHCYRFVQREKTWAKAGHYCTKKFNASLTSIRSKEELEFISKLQYPTITKFNWIEKEDIRELSDGSPWGYSVWIEAKPDSWPWSNKGSFALRNSTEDGSRLVGMEEEMRGDGKLWKLPFVCKIPPI